MLNYSKQPDYVVHPGFIASRLGKGWVQLPNRIGAPSLPKDRYFTELHNTPEWTYKKIMHFCRLWLGAKLESRKPQKLTPLQVYDGLKADYPWMRDAYFKDLLRGLENESKISVFEDRIVVLDEQHILKLSNDYYTLREVANGYYVDSPLNLEDTANYFSIKSSVDGLIIRNIYELMELFHLNGFMHSDSYTFDVYAAQYVENLQKELYDKLKTDGYVYAFGQDSNIAPMVRRLSECTVESTNYMYLLINENPGVHNPAAVAMECKQIMDELRSNTIHRNIIIEIANRDSIDQVVGTLEDVGIEIDFVEHSTRRMLIINTKVQQIETRDLVQAAAMYLKHVIERAYTQDHMPSFKKVTKLQLSRAEANFLVNHYGLVEKLAGIAPAKDYMSTPHFIVMPYRIPDIKYELNPHARYEYVY